MAKQIKSFTVDDEIYRRLVSKFKKYKPETSVSLFLNNRLNELLDFIEDVEKGMKKYSFSIPMSFVIDEAVKGTVYGKKLSDELDEEGDPAPELWHKLKFLEEWYEADKQGVPRELYRWYKFGGYVVSKDKKFLIEKDTGRKFIPRGSLLTEVREVESKKIKPGLPA
jgi:hypothetical protein